MDGAPIKGFRSTIPGSVNDPCTVPLRPAPARRGVRPMSTPGLSASISARPDVTVTDSMALRSSATGIRPNRFGASTLTLPNVTAVVVHDAPRLPSSAERPVPRPPLSMRSAITNGTAVSINDQTLPPAGRSCSQRGSKSAPSPTCWRSTTVSVGRGDSVASSVRTSRDSSVTVRVDAGAGGPLTVTTYVPGARPANDARRDPGGMLDVRRVVGSSSI